METISEQLIELNDLKEQLATNLTSIGVEASTDESLKTLVPKVLDIGTVKNDIALNRTTLGYQRKNLFKNTAVSQTAYGVTFTINDDKSITVNGTATQIIYFNMGSFYFEADKQYILNGCPSGGSETKYFLAYDGMPGHQYDFGNGSTFTLSKSIKTSMLLVIKSGQTVSNLTFKPMLRYADIIDDTYEPYKESVDERLIKNKSDIAVNKTTLGTQCKNFHDTLSVNWYQPGKTSVASDGTVTTTITSDSRSFTYASSEHYITLEAGNYIITANTLEFVAGSSALIRGCNSDNQSLFALSVSSAGLHKAAFSLSKKTTIGIMYKLYSQTCKIMIRDADILDDTYEPYQPSVQEQIIGAYFPMTIQKGIGDNTDLNTITEVGNYICWSGSSASTMSNCPTKAGGFRLIVTNRFQDCNESDNLRYQWIIPNNQDSVLYYRRSFDTSTNSFGSWYSFGGTVVS